jgi:predicted nucleotidyltransferase
MNGTPISPSWHIPKKGIIIPKMGTINSPGLGDVLFGKAQRRVLALLFGNPDRTYYVNEIVRLAEAGIGAVQRELGRLEATGLVVVTRVGNQKHYQANRQAPIFDELRGIVVKTFGVADHLRSALAPIAKRIRAAFIYGSIAKGTDTASSDVDLMILSDDVSFSDVIKALTTAEQQIGRSVSPTIFGVDEWRAKLGEEGGFLQRVLVQPKLFLIGTEDDIPSARKPGEDRQVKERSSKRGRVRRAR